MVDAWERGQLAVYCSYRAQRSIVGLIPPRQNNNLHNEAHISAHHSSISIKLTGYFPQVLINFRGQFHRNPLTNIWDLSELMELGSFLKRRNQTTISVPSTERYLWCLSRKERLQHIQTNYTQNTPGEKTSTVRREKYESRREKKYRKTLYGWKTVLSPCDR